MLMDLVNDYRTVFKPGMKVRINDVCHATNNKWSLVFEMKDMKGKVYKINSVDADRVTINGYLWAGEDLTIEDETISKDAFTKIQDTEKSKDLKLEIVTFNPNDLVL